MYIVYSIQRDAFLTGETSLGIIRFCPHKRWQPWSDDPTRKVETYVLLEPGEVTAYIVRYIESSRSVVIPASGRYDATHQINPQVS